MPPVALLRAIALGFWRPTCGGRLCCGGASYSLRLVLGSVTLGSAEGCRQIHARRPQQSLIVCLIVACP